MTRRSRRDFVSAALALPMLTAPTVVDGVTYQLADPAAWPGVVLQPDEGEHLVSGRRRAPMRIKVNSRAARGAAISMLVSEVAPGASIPVHLHKNEDELTFIHSGSGVITLGDRRVPSRAGAMLYAPKGVWHGVENTGTDTLTWCAVYSPAGFEQYFIEAGVPAGSGRSSPPPDVVAKLAEKYGMVFRDPA